MSAADQSCSVGKADEPPVDTFDLELSADEMMALRSAPVLRPERATSSIDPPARPLPVTVTPPATPDLSRVPVQIAIALTLALAEIGGVWHLSSVSDRSVRTIPAIAEVHVPAAKPGPPLPPAERPRVIFTNPFDASEVFDFPPGTSETEAHDAVADLLLQRARDRRPLLAKMKRVLRADIRTPRAVTAQNSSRLHE